MAPEGSLSEEDASLLWDVGGRCQGPILEVGCYLGRSTTILGCLGRPVYAVDSHGSTITRKGRKCDEICAAFLSYLDERGLSNVEHFRQRIEDWETRPVGFAFLDGDHSYNGTVAQIEAALNCGPTDICVHDYVPGKYDRIIKAVHDTPLEIIELRDETAHCRPV